MDDSGMRLDDMLCFPLYATSRAVTRTYGLLLAGLDLTYPQYLVMLALWESSPMSVRELGERLHLDSGTLSPLLKRLESAGRVVRTRDTEDERRVLVSLTAEGRELEERAAGVPGELGRAMGISLAEVVELRERLSVLLSHLEATRLD
ncbi:MAG: MarR family transcriptional regulator [Nocardioides sp.]|uniref:MarR family winged helix-turn-helix transcriptional regulator n=1 Tax=Nocardioides sp. TaxID=35761 RepID=UPI0039E64CC8